MGLQFAIHFRNRPTDHHSTVGFFGVPPLRLRDQLARINARDKFSQFAFSGPGVSRELFGKSVSEVSRDIVNEAVN